MPAFINRLCDLPPPLLCRARLPSDDTCCLLTSRVVRARPSLSGIRIAPKWRSGLPQGRGGAPRVAAAAPGHLPPAPADEAAGPGDGALSALASCFPICVLAAAALGMHSPSAFAWFGEAAFAPALAATMVGACPWSPARVWRARATPHDRMHATRAGLLRSHATHPMPPLPLPQLGMGLTLNLGDFKQALAAPGQVLAGCALQYSVMPALAFAVSHLMGLPLAYTIG